MKTCDECRDAEDDPRRDVFTAGCMSCSARALAAACVLDVDVLRKPPTYRSTLEKLFGVDAKHGHALIVHWRSRIAAEKARQIAIEVAA